MVAAVAPARRKAPQPSTTTSTSSKKSVLPTGGKRPQAVTSANGSNKRAKQQQPDESRAVVAHRDVDMADADVVEISSGEEEESELEESEEEEEANEKENQRPAGAANDVDMADGEEAGSGAGEAPSFGEQLQANAPEVVDVEAEFADASEGAREARGALAPVVGGGNRALSAPSATSLGTVLTQALKTNDRELLESCFEMNDLDSVRSTIERLPSTLVANLLRRLAERLHKRPGRAGNIMVWIQWALVSHGGYLAGRQDIMRELGSLNRVIKERASGLQPLLTLKGKLDMLSAQLELRRSMQRTATMDDDEDEDGVIYVEGQESESEDEDNGSVANGGAVKRLKAPLDNDLDDGIESSADEDNAMNFNAEGEDDDADSDDSDAEGGMLDDEADETDNDSGDDEESENDLEEVDDDGEDVSGSDALETPRPTKRSTAAQRMGFGSGRRR
ncbi:uncharacterized protein K452DRAFT_289545 [Aplosporella prunicola CBS 121167]|uniref:Small-subunit processome Utp12 domain-containing protein n=1 Tax=Aplosporella prunicola CBS 121167 TaxID=1176127 RepID=A0A6A6B6N8_9PEZI|nr:uncharacterized protein K452DRAFT_289545 [Aplosporella prunicola CBS 121167]KAF2139546.1 hypothetical protein K452DRAFT_289545 [Aplosporella prunicola CBS 121167]